MSKQNNDNYSLSETKTAFTSEHIKRAVESPAGQFITWIFPKVGWLVVLWFMWSAKAYMDGFVAESKTVMTMQAAAARLESEVAETKRAGERNSTQLAQMQVNQITISESLKRTTEILQNAQVNQAVLDARVSNLEKISR